MTSNVFTQLKHIGLRSNKGMVDLSFYKVRCLILIDRVLPGKNGARLLLVSSFSQKKKKELEHLHEGYVCVVVFSFSFRGDALTETVSHFILALLHPKAIGLLLFPFKPL